MSSAIKGTREYNEKIERAEKWLGKNHTIKDESSLQEMDKIFDESLIVFELLREFKSFINKSDGEVYQRILEIDEGEIKRILFGLKESKSKGSLKEIFEPLGDKIHEFYTLTLEAHNTTPDEQDIKEKWISELYKLGL